MKYVKCINCKNLKKDCRYDYVCCDKFILTREDVTTNRVCNKYERSERNGKARIK